MKYIVAVSGGVDSVVLLDILSRGDDTLIVAHVDHGIREESGEDARFVQALSKVYGLPYVQTALRLGKTASEEQAREARYEFLFALAREHGAQIVTAHHQDDMIGSIAINLQRGTGWRGLAVLNRPGIVRPLLGLNKQKLYEYALTHRLEWVEDATNHSPKYLRNRLRAGVVGLSSVWAREIVKLRARQVQLAHDIDQEVAQNGARFGDGRHAYAVIDSAVAIELLRAMIKQQTTYRPTSEQASRLLLEIKTAMPGTTVDVAAGVRVRFTKTTFVVDTSREMVK